MRTSVKDLLERVLGSSCVAYSSVAQSIPTGTVTTLSWDSESVDTDSMHDPSINNSRITIKKFGLYIVYVQLWWVANGTGQRNVKLIKNGGAINPSSEKRQAAWAGDWNVVDTFWIGFLQPGDYIEAQGFQTSGAALNTGSSQLGFLGVGRLL